MLMVPDAVFDVAQGPKGCLPLPSSHSQEREREIALLSLANDSNQDTSS